MWNVCRNLQKLSICTQKQQNLRSKLGKHLRSVPTDLVSNFENVSLYARLFCCKPDSMLMSCWDASLTGFRREKRRWRTCYTYYTRSMINSLKAGENSTNLAHERRFWAKARVELLNTATRPDWSVETINVHICHVKRSCDRKKYAQKLAQYIQKPTGTTQANLTKIC